MIKAMNLDDIRKRFKPKKVDERIGESIGVELGENTSDNVFHNLWVEGADVAVRNRGKRNRFYNGRAYL